jgi:hypothetical protein
MTKIEFNLELLEINDLAPNEYVHLYLLFNGISHKVFGDEQITLDSKGFIRITPEGIIITKKGVDVFAKKSKKEAAKQEDLYEFVEKYRQLFPDGIKSMGRIAKTDAYSCINKFKSFKKKFKFTEEQILEATRQYIALKKRVNYDKITCSDYFIEKNGASMLASYCENLNKQTNYERTSQSGDI